MSEQYRHVVSFECKSGDHTHRATVFVDQITAIIEPPNKEAKLCTVRLACGEKLVAQESYDSVLTKIASNEQL